MASRSNIDKSSSLRPQPPRPLGPPRPTPQNSNSRIPTFHNPNKETPGIIKKQVGDRVVLKSAGHQQHNSLHVDDAPPVDAPPQSLLNRNRMRSASNGGAIPNIPNSNGTRRLPSTNVTRSVSNHGVIRNPSSKDGTRNLPHNSAVQSPPHNNGIRNISNSNAVQNVPHNNAAQGHPNSHGAPMYSTERRGRFVTDTRPRERPPAEQSFTTVEEQRVQIQSLLEINSRGQKRIKDLEIALRERDQRERDDKRKGMTRVAEAEARSKYLEDLNGELTDLNRDLDITLTTVNAKLKNLAQQYMHLESEYHDLKSREKARELEQKSREFRISEPLNRKIKDLEAENRHLNVTLSSAREHNRMMRLDLADLEQKTADVEETVAKVRQRDAFLIETNRELRRRISILQPDDDAILKRNTIRPVSNVGSITSQIHSRAVSEGGKLFHKDSNASMNLEAPEDLGGLSVWLNAMGNSFHQEVKTALHPASDIDSETTYYVSPRNMI